MKKNRGFNIIIAVLILITAAYVAISYNSLPDMIPSHWNFDGEIDSYSSKVMLYFMVLGMVGLNVLFVVVRRIDPRSDNYEKFNRPFQIFRIFMTAFFMVLIFASIRIAQNPGSFEMGTLVPVMVGLLFVVIGNYMPKFRHNYTMGIKTPWTLASETCWDKTHRFAGPLWMAGGVMFMVSSFVFSESAFRYVFILIIVVLVVVPAAYSYLEFQNEKK